MGVATSTWARERRVMERDVCDELGVELEDLDRLERDVVRSFMRMPEVAKMRPAKARTFFASVVEGLEETCRRAYGREPRREVYMREHELARRACESAFDAACDRWPELKGGPCLLAAMAVSRFHDRIARVMQHDTVGEARKDR